jgi:hypothetical protein
VDFDEGNAEHEARGIRERTAAGIRVGQGAQIERGDGPDDEAGMVVGWKLLIEKLPVRKSRLPRRGGEVKPLAAARRRRYDHRGLLARESRVWE